MGSTDTPDEVRSVAAAVDDEQPWDARIFARVDSGVDGTLIAENLKLTPTERLERMQQLLASVRALRSAHADRLPGDS